MRWQAFSHFRVGFALGVPISTWMTTVRLFTYVQILMTCHSPSHMQGFSGMINDESSGSALRRLRNY